MKKKIQILLLKQTRTLNNLKHITKTKLHYTNLRIRIFRLLIL